MQPKLVVISVSGGCADVVRADDGCKVIIKDYDNHPDLDSYEWQVIGPDDLEITPDNFSSVEEAYEGMYAFIERFRQQGYYSSVNGRIPVDILQRYCRIVMLTAEGAE